MGESTISQPESKTRGVVTALSVIVAVLGVAAFFGWSEWERRQMRSELQETRRELEQVLGMAGGAGDEAAMAVLDDIRSLIHIPDDEEPAVAAIVDAESLREEDEFYALAKNGDYIVVTNTKAILYDPEEHILLNVAPVYFEDEETFEDDAIEAPEEEDSVSEEEE